MYGPGYGYSKRRAPSYPPSGPPSGYDSPGPEYDSPGYPPQQYRDELDDGRYRPGSTRPVPRGASFLAFLTWKVLVFSFCLAMCSVTAGFIGGTRYSCAHPNGQVLTQQSQNQQGGNTPLSRIQLAQADLIAATDRLAKLATENRPATNKKAPPRPPGWKQPSKAASKSTAAAKSTATAKAHGSPGSHGGSSGITALPKVSKGKALFSAPAGAVDSTAAGNAATAAAAHSTSQAAHDSAAHNGVHSSSSGQGAHGVHTASTLGTAAGMQKVHKTAGVMTDSMHAAAASHGNGARNVSAHFKELLAQHKGTAAKRALIAKQESGGVATAKVANTAGSGSGTAAAKSGSGSGSHAKAAADTAATGGPEDFLVASHETYTGA